MQKLKGQKHFPTFLQKVTSPADVEIGFLMQPVLRVSLQKVTYQQGEMLFAAVKAAHQQNIILRDIRPDNLLQDEKGNPYLIDFGYSLSVKGDGEKHKYDGTFLTASSRILDHLSKELEMFFKDDHQALTKVKT